MCFLNFSATLGSAAQDDFPASAPPYSATGTPNGGTRTPKYGHHNLH